MWPAWLSRRSSEPSPIDASRATRRVIFAARALRTTRGRREHGAFLVEGPRAIFDAVSSGIRPRHFLVAPDGVSDDRIAALRSIAPEVPLLTVNGQDLRSIVDTETPQSILAVCTLPQPESRVRGPVVLVLDGVHDPGNLGTALRSAAASGLVDSIVLLGGADPYAPKVVRASAGAIFHLAITRLESTELAGLLAGRRVYVAEADGEATYETADWSGDIAIVVGGEASGPSSESRSLAAARIRIPMAPLVESLNAGVVASILLFEAARQRRVITE